MSDSKVNLLNRLVDYFLVVGLSDDREPEVRSIQKRTFNKLKIALSPHATRFVISGRAQVMFKENGRTVYKPQLIDRYPAVDYDDIPYVHIAPNSLPPHPLHIFPKTPTFARDWRFSFAHVLMGGLC
jgi:hypothetical protein